MPMPDAIVIPEEEKNVVKSQILQGLRQKYLRYKAEYLGSDANDQTEEAARWQGEMDKVVAAYERVEIDL